MPGHWLRPAIRLLALVTAAPIGQQKLPGSGPSQLEREPVMACSMPRR